MTNPALTGFNPVVSLMHHIKESGNEWPRVRLDLDGQPLVLTVAGERAKTPGAVNLTDGKRYPDSRYYGKITPAGEFQPGESARYLDPAMKRALWAVLTRMRDGEAESVFAENGKRLGKCCMCGRALSDAESVAIGIGPICRAMAFG